MLSFKCLTTKKPGLKAHVCASFGEFFAHSVSLTPNIINKSVVSVPRGKTWRTCGIYHESTNDTQHISAAVLLEASRTAIWCLQSSENSLQHTYTLLQLRDYVHTNLSDGALSHSEKMSDSKDRVDLCQSSPKTSFCHRLQLRAVQRDTCKGWKKSVESHLEWINAERHSPLHPRASSKARRSTNDFILNSSKTSASVLHLPLNISTFCPVKPAYRLLHSITPQKTNTNMQKKAFLLSCPSMLLHAVVHNLCTAVLIPN